MSGCREVHRHLYEYLDRELSPVDVVEIRHHLLCCRECYELVAVEASVMKLVKQDCGCVSAPEHLKARLRVMLGSPDQTNA